MQVPYGAIIQGIHHAYLYARAYRCGRDNPRRPHRHRNSVVQWTIQLEFICPLTTELQRSEFSGEAELSTERIISRIRVRYASTPSTIILAIRTTPSPSTKRLRGQSGAATSGTRGGFFLSMLPTASARSRSDA